MKRSAGLVLLALLPAFATCASEHSGHGAQSNVWTAGLPHVTSTTNGEAQRFFDQGLLHVYAFNHAAAMAAFEQALRLDESFALMHWGKLDVIANPWVIIMDLTNVLRGIYESEIDVTLRSRGDLGWSCAATRCSG
jgi:hypothetical protein